MLDEIWTDRDEVIVDTAGSRPISRVIAAGDIVRLRAAGPSLDEGVYKVIAAGSTFSILHPVGSHPGEPIAFPISRANMDLTHGLGRP